MPWRAIFALLMFAGSAGCEAKDEGNSAPPHLEANEAVPRAAPMPAPPGPAPSLSSPAFVQSGSIPAEFTCDGAGGPPPLEWTKPLDGTRSFVLIVDDPDAPNGTFRHWGAYDIPLEARAIVGGKAPGRTLLNDFGQRGYGPPCPPKGNGPHRYRFKLYGLKADHLKIDPKADLADLQAAIDHAAARGDVSTESDLMGTYERK